MLRVGITGGIGSGKSTVCRVFEELGISVYYADAEVKKMYAENAELQHKITALFGPESFQNGILNRPFISSRVFKDPALLQQLNAIVHPLVFADYDTWCEAHKNETYTLKEAAIMFESGSDKQMDFIIGVTAPLELRIARTMQRDGLSREDVIARIQKQMPDEELIKRCDFLIENDGDKSLVQQVLNLHHILLEKAK